jgi:hypothetical protein
MAQPIHLDVAQLNRYLARTDTGGEIPSPFDLMQTAYQALVDFGVFKLYDRPLVSRGPVEVDRTGITLKYDQTSLYWTVDRIPSIGGVIAGLAYHLATVVNEPPTPGPWPKTLS